ncbi:hypothetical protein PRIC2_002890 [Phytophthora ramorum]
MSGASQVALNAMKSTQDALSRMEVKQDERLAQQDANMNQAFQAIQALDLPGRRARRASAPDFEVPDESPCGCPCAPLSSRSP